MVGRLSTIDSVEDRFSRFGGVSTIDFGIVVDDSDSARPPPSPPSRDGGLEGGLGFLEGLVFSGFFWRASSWRPRDFLEGGFLETWRGGVVSFSHIVRFEFWILFQG